MIEVLEKHLNKNNTHHCIVSEWISALSTEEQTLFKKVKDDKTVSVAGLFNDLNSEIKLPFKLTAFRSHMRGYCTCQ